MSTPYLKAAASLVLALGVLPGCAGGAASSSGTATTSVGELSPEGDAVVLHPIHRETFVCSYHNEEAGDDLGNALGVDCWVQSLVTVPETGAVWSRPYRTDGQTNDDWFAWRREVLAPISGTVVTVTTNNTENVPGLFKPSPGAEIVIRGDDGTNVLMVHVRETAVAEGDRVEAGQVVARVGNNGSSRAPHTPLGAWRDDEPLRIIFDPSVPRHSLLNGEPME